MRPRAAAIIAFLLSSLAASPSLRAQPEPAPTTPLGAAQRSYAQGQRYYNEAEQHHDPALYEAAYLQFAQAYAVYQDDRVLWNLALSELRTKRAAQALGHLREYDRHTHALAQASHPMHGRIARFIEEARQALGHIAIDAPAGARVAIDGKDYGVAPLGEAVDVEPGSHVVELAVGEARARTNVSVGAGETTRPQLSIPTPAPSATGSTSAPPSASTPPPPPPPPPPPESGFWNGRRTVGAVVAGVAVVSFGAALGSGLVASSKGDDATTFRTNNPGPCASPRSATCGQYTSILGDRSTALDAEHGLLIGGAALAVTGAVLLLWPRSPESTSGAWIAPSVGARGAGLELRGSF